MSEIKKEFDRAEIIKALVEKGASEFTADLVVRELPGVIIEALASGQRVEWFGFASLELVHQKPRVYTNPRTREKVEKPERQRLRFHRAKAIKTALQKHGIEIV